MENSFNPIGYFFENSFFVKENLFYANGLGRICNNPNFRIDRNRYFDYLIMYLITGKLTVEQYGTTSVLESGKFILMNLNHQHKYYSDINEPCEILWIHFGGNECNKLISAYIGSKNNLPFISVSKNILKYIKNCISIAELKGDSQSLSMSLNIYKLLISSFVILKETGNAKINSKYDQLIEKIDKYTNDNIHKKITLFELSAYVNISQYHFSRIIKNVTGSSPMKYILDKKINKAKYFLVYTDKKIVEIAKDLGFSDQSHFSRSFHQMESIYPGQYRKDYFK